MGFRKRSERREAARFQFDRGTSQAEPARILTILSGKKFIVPVRELVDLSKTGIALEVDRRHAPPIGEKIAVEFRIPGSQKVALMARVANLTDVSDEPQKEGRVRVGLKFENIPDKAVRLVESATSGRMTEAQAQAPVTHEWIEVRFYSRKVQRYLFQMGLAILAIFGVYHFVLAMLRYGESQWWVDEAYKFAERIEKNSGSPKKK